MSSVPFFAGNGDPSAIQRAYAVQTADGVPRLIADATPFKCYGGRVAPSPKWIDRLVLNSRPMRSRPMTSKVDIVGLTTSLGDFDPANPMTLLALTSFFQGYDITTSGDHERWRISQKQAEDGTSFYKKFSLFHDADKGLAMRIVDSLVSGWTLGVQPRQNAKFDLQYQVGPVDFWPDAEVTGTGAVKPFLRHYMDEQFDVSTTTGDVVITIVSDDATTVTFTAKKGAGSASANQVAIKGRWTYVYLDNPAQTPLGNRAQQIQIYFPTGANGNFVDADVWTFQSRYSLDYDDAVDYDTAMPMAETQFRFFFADGSEVVVDNGVTVNAAVPGAITRYRAGGEQSVGGDRKGRHDITIGLDRRHVDLDLIQALMQRREVAFIAESKNDITIGASTAYYGGLFVAPSAVVEGDFHDAEEGGENFDEQFTLRCGLPDDAFDLSAVLAGYTGINDVGADIEWIVDTHHDATSVGLV